MDKKMKKIIVACICILLTFYLISSVALRVTKENNGEWNKEYGGRECDDIEDIKYTSDGAFVIAGRTMSFGNGGYDAWLIKIDKNGNEVWNKTYGGTKEDIAYSVVESEDGYIIGGYTLSYGDNKGDFWLIYTDKNGNEIWNRTYDKGELDYATKVIKTGDGYIMMGVTYYPPRKDGYVDSDIWMIKVDKNGNEIWDKTYGGNWTEYGDDIIEIDDGYLLSGITASYTTYGGYDAWLIKIDENGTEQWNKTYGWEQFEIHSYISQADDGCMLTGYTEYTPMGGKIFLIKVDEEGNEQWSQAYGAGLEQVRDIERVDEGYVLAGSQSAISVGGCDAWLVRVDEQGNELWSKNMGGAVEEVANAVVEVDGYYYIAAGKAYQNPFDRNAWIIKCDDFPPPQITITRPRGQYLYIFDREIMPLERTLVLGKITVIAEVSGTTKIDRVEFYVTIESYEYEPRKVLYEPPYTWTWDETVITLRQPVEITVAGHYGGAGGIAVDHIWPMWIYNINI